MILISFIGGDGRTDYETFDTIQEAKDFIEKYDCYLVKMYKLMNAE